MNHAEVSDVVLAPTQTLLEALRVLEQSGREIIFVCDGSGTLLGTLTDGDVRRALLLGASLHQATVDQSMQTSFIAVGSATGRAEVLDMMRARGIRQVPILDERGRLIGMHTLLEMVGAVTRPNWAVIMAGGKGTRLRPITEAIPKPMIRVAGRPILERIIYHLVGFGIRRIFLSINYLGHMVEEYFGDGSQFGCRIEYLRETSPLGTGGALSLLPELPDSPMVVMNGDLVTQVDIGRLLRFTGEGGYAATMGVRQHTVEIPFGVAEVCDGRLVGLQEKPTSHMLVNAGTYVLTPDVLPMVPKDKEFPITDLFRLCIERQLPVGVHLIEDDWEDIGRPEELLRARGYV
jgi:dTDP-glucose pyrophosphorylase/CBS domain-containing protein